jgi:hypothetical protein
MYEQQVRVQGKVICKYDRITNVIYSMLIILFYESLNNPKSPITHY